MWRQTELSLQQVPICPNVGVNYPYKAYLDTMLSASHEAAESVLQAELFYLDDAGFHESVNLAEPVNSGLEVRSKYFSGGIECQMEGGLHVDFCKVPRLLLNGVPVNVKMFPHTGAFALMSGGNERYELEITDAVLRVCTVEPASGVLLGHS